MDSNITVSFCETDPLRELSNYRLLNNEMKLLNLWILLIYHWILATACALHKMMIKQRILRVECWKSSSSSCYRVDTTADTTSLSILRSLTPLGPLLFASATPSSKTVLAGTVPTYLLLLPFFNEIPPWLKYQTLIRIFCSIFLCVLFLHRYVGVAQNSKIAS